MAMQQHQVRVKRHKLAVDTADLCDRSARPIPAALAVIAAGRDHVVTEEFARAMNRANQTIRKNYCTTGSCFGIRPIKVGNRLLWPVVQIAALLNGETSMTA
jgi:hypothetical protein